MSKMLALLLLIRLPMMEGVPARYACVPDHTYQVPTIEWTPVEGQVCVAFYPTVETGWKDRNDAMRQAVRDAGPHCMNRSKRVGDTWAPQELNDLIAQFFPPEAWEAACDTAWGESRFNMASVSDNKCCIGYFQMHTRFHQWRAAPDTLDTPTGNVRAAASLWSEQGWGPWEAASHRSDTGDGGPH